MGEVVRLILLGLRPHVVIRDNLEKGGFLVGVAHDQTAYPFSGEFGDYGEALDHAAYVSEALSLPILDRSRTGIGGAA